MMHLVAAASAALLVLIAAALPRRVAGTRWHIGAALALDLALPVSIFVLIALASGRPIFAGLVTLALGAGYAYADHAKRATLQEPIVFTDVFQAFDIFRHPQLALPFPNKGQILLGVASVLAAFVAFYWLEPRSFQAPLWIWIALLAPVLALIAVLRRPLRGRALAWLKRLGASGDPAVDAAQLGPLAIHWVYALVAAGERDHRCMAAAVRIRVDADELTDPVVVVQSESFFDARRLHAAIDRSLLPNFDRACRDGLQWGRLKVPCWGANTVRTEFAVLSGMPQAALGFDHFNPYHRFARAPVDTLAWRMRSRGYRTICLHPFDARFYGRDRIMRNLGFDQLIDESAFPADAQRVEGYIGDLAVARLTTELLRRYGPKVFVFVVTMENHGPWRGRADALQSVECLSVLGETERNSVNRYLASLRNADAMLGSLRDTLEREFSGGTLAFYGDHLPGFPSAYQKLGLADRRSDYLIWRADAGPGSRIDLRADNLADAIMAGFERATEQRKSA
ncbi:MAG: synthase family protein [Hydrocarboniphaga sp.]|uniref:LTA synthase family protein n=1 Tax=Hydrocarboniphaga sp. TaxID=2033016 RepID=UPI002632DF76|nr:LTA synthase family protein [Hydrocarboniphaga sp.]MDB5972044.1 synthase family protein [Hydrocarboniphaga sp.]